MRKIIVSEMISLDGFFAGVDGDISWHVVEEEFNNYAIRLLKTADTILFGRITYELFENYWPAAAKNPKTSKSDLKIAKYINDATKIVFSKTLKKTHWNSVHITKNLTPKEITKLKQAPGKNIVVYGSGTIVQKLADMGLIDEYRLFVAPVILGKGKPLWKNNKHGLQLKLKKSQKFGSGVVALYYLPIWKSPLI